MLSSPLHSTPLWVALAFLPAPAGPPGECAPPHLAAPAEGQESWSATLERDGRLGFPPKSATAALLALENPLLGPDERGAALVALGAAGATARRRTLESWASEGQGYDRVGAILGLGELGSELGDSDLLLVELMAVDDPLVAEAALLALLRTGLPGWRELAEGIAADESHRLATVAAKLVDFVTDPASAQPTAAIVILFDMRWTAAKRYGTVDGRAWNVTLLELLADDSRFLDQVVLPSAAEIDRAGVKDHLLQLLIEPGGIWHVRAAVRAMPREVDRMLDAKVWIPTEEAQWEAMLDEALKSGVTPLTPTLLQRAVRFRRLSPTAAALSAKGDTRLEDLVVAALGAEQPELRWRAAHGIGAAGLAHLLPRLVSLEDDPDPLVASTARVARLLLGDQAPHKYLKDLFSSRDGEARREERIAAREALARAGRSGNLSAFIQDLSEHSRGLDRADLLAILALRGRKIDGGELRDAYPLAQPGSPTALRLLDGLGRMPAPADLAFLVELFPRDGDRATNVVLARSLIRNGHRKVEPILQAAVWSEPWNRSVLAAAVARESSGLRILLHWIIKPPPEATSEDIRRLGFAIGEWGGLEAVDELRSILGGVAGADRPALQGALLGALSARTH